MQYIKYLSLIDFTQVRYFFLNISNFLHSSFIGSSSRQCRVGVGQRSKRDFDIEHFGCQSTTTTTCTFKSPFTCTHTHTHSLGYGYGYSFAGTLLGPIASRIRLNAQIELGNWKRVVCPIVVVVVIGQRNLILVSWTIGYVSMLYVCMYVCICLVCAVTLPACLLPAVDRGSCR